MLQLFFIPTLFVGRALAEIPSDSTPSIASNGAIEIISVCVGLEGFYKNGLWTPITVEWSDEKRETGFSLSVSSVDSDGTPIVYRQTVSASKPNGDGNVPTIFRETLYAKLGRRTATVFVEIEDATRSRRARKTLVPSGDPIRMRRSEKTADADRFYEPLPSERPIFLIVGNEDIGLQGAIAELSLREDRRPLLVKVDSFAELPDCWFGYEAVDMLVLTTTEPEQFAGQTSDSPRIRAIDDWIRMGGRLFFCAGKNSKTFLDPENGALRPFLPGQYQGMTALMKSEPLETFVASKRQIAMRGTEDAPNLEMPRFTEPRGVVSLRELDQAIVLRCTHGLGTIVYFGGDLSGKPLAGWRDRISFVRKILLWTNERQATVSGGASLIQLGYNDISGQVRSALDRFDDVRIVPFSILLAILVLYWLIVGPGDRFLVLNVLKKPVLTWLTFPLWIILFSVLAYCLATPGRPNRTMINELDLVDIDDETGFVRMSSWGSLYSSGDRRYSLQLELPEEFRFSIFSWNGLPGSGLGGMAPKTISPTVWQTGSEQFPVSESGSRGVEHVPVQVRSTKSFFGQNWISTKKTPIQLTAELTDTEGVPTGTLALPDSMPPLDDCILAYGRWAIEIGSIEPGRPVELTKTTPRLELRELLLPRDVQSDSHLKRLASYNTQSGDLTYVVRVLSLHGALGGYEACGLYNTFQRSLDLSDHLPINRALLIGTVRIAGNPSFGPSIAVIPEDDAKPDGIPSRRHVVLRQSIPVTPSRLQIYYAPDILDAPAPTSKSNSGVGEYKLDIPGR